MCGIAGFIGKKGSFDSIHVLDQMGAAIQHRGPDSSGTWHDSNDAVYLAHRRLAILELTPAGHQPMETPDWVVSFNGEIYNHLEIRTHLVADYPVSFRGNSDTETLIWAIQFMGLERALKSSVGMFAFAAWSKKEKTLYLVRDRMGEKPLYYQLFDHSVIFGSELKALKKHPSFKSDVSYEALYRLFQLGYIPQDSCIYKHTYKVKPGCYVKFENDSSGELRPIERCYWSLTPKINTELSSDQALKELKNRMVDSLSGQSISDVPMGAFLSGGVDSSLICAVLQSLRSSPINTFSIGFEEEGFDESEYAESVAKHIGTHHHSLKVTGRDALDLVPNLAQIYNEPFADSSQLPTILLSRLTRNFVKVAISGDGGDELFGGYNRYIWAKKITSFTKRTPAIFVYTLSKLLQSPLPIFFDLGIVHKQFKRVGFNLPVQVQGKAQKLAAALESKSLMDLYLKLISQNETPERYLSFFDQAPPHSNPSGFFDLLESKRLDSELQKMSYMDALTYLPDDIMVKVDRASMSASLETRAPFLDHRIVEFAFSLPDSLKVNQSIGKVLLKDYLYQHVPRHLIDRPKMGFGVPLAKWLRLELKTWGSDLIHSKRSREFETLNISAIYDLWDEHQSGKGDRHYQLWPILIFLQWLEAN